MGARRVLPELNPPGEHPARRPPARGGEGSCRRARGSGRRGQGHRARRAQGGGVEGARSAPRSGGGERPRSDRTSRSGSSDAGGRRRGRRRGTRGGRSGRVGLEAGGGEKSRVASGARRRRSWPRHGRGRPDVRHGPRRPSHGDLVAPPAAPCASARRDYRRRPRRGRRPGGQSEARARPSGARGLASAGTRTLKPGGRRRWPG